jgi:hypothetical protein
MAKRARKTTTPTPPPTPKTRAERFAEAVEERAWLIKRLQDAQATKLAELRAFGEKIAKGEAHQIAHALSWGRTEYEAAATAQVTAEILLHLEKGVTPATIREHALREALRGARTVPSSTSQTSNLMEAYVTAAWAEIASDGYSSSVLPALVRIDAKIQSLGFEIEAGLV